ncbi:uncharacterized protein F5891DRAFT_1001842 [Suillus fuscotomentosus]|uniref:CcmS related domain-containing protein n=1 Tax=Suillus fuscotomentosus TaxID=1912939 RepID=A0AAD4HU84_9AGAM|nr:uncharacterized protein F5891DRAFT_1001842 [Suillus fuscotomentosus]KAG1907454.1 hypothetical protein F5891DRAFT_1001842 [Suillus fuscotomentosus]
MILVDSVSPFCPSHIHGHRILKVIFHKGDMDAGELNEDSWEQMHDTGDAPQDLNGWASNDPQNSNDDWATDEQWETGAPQAQMPPRQLHKDDGNTKSQKKQQHQYQQQQHHQHHQQHQQHPQQQQHQQSQHNDGWGSGGGAWEDAGGTPAPAKKQISKGNWSQTTQRAMDEPAWSNWGHEAGWEQDGDTSEIEEEEWSAEDDSWGAPAAAWPQQQSTHAPQAYPQKQSTHAPQVHAQRLPNQQSGWQTWGEEARRLPKSQQPYAAANPPPGTGGYFQPQGTNKQVSQQQSANTQWSQQQAVMSAAFRQQQEQAYALAQAQSQHKQLQQQQHRHVQQQHSETYALAHAQNQHRQQHHHQNQPQHHQNPSQLPHHQNPSQLQQHQNPNQLQHHQDQNQNQPQHHHDPSQPQHYHQPQHHHDPNQQQHYHNPNQPQHHHDPNQQQHYHNPNQPQHHHDQNQPQHHQDSNQPQHEGKKHKKDKESKQNKKEKKRQQKEQEQQEQQQHDNDVWGLGEGWQDEDDPDDYEDTHDAWGRRVHFSPPHTAPSVAPSTVVENFIVNAFPPNKLGLSTFGGTPSKTLTYAYHGTAAPMENRPARNTTHDFADFIESKGAAISPVAGAFFGGNSRMAKDRFHWMFPPDKDERVASKLEWIQSVSPGLGSFGLQKFLQTRERGALIVNADYRPSKSPNEPAFDWLTYPELQKTMDRTLQESVAFYDPSALVVVFVFLPSKSGNSLAIWRRKIAVPSSVRLAYQAQITQAIDSLHRDYSVYVDEIPPPKSEAPSPPKKRKWWKLWLST